MIKYNLIPIETKGCRKIKHYESLGYDINKDVMMVKVEHVTKGSRKKVAVICDYCNKESITTLKQYFLNISNGDKYACCQKCGSMKSKETLLERYGVTHHMKLDEVKENVKNTNLRKYGVEYLQQSDEFKNKSKETLLNKYGVDHISKSEIYKDKFKKTCLINHGVEYPMMSDKIRNKSKTTSLKKYKVDNPAKSNIVKGKVKETNLKKYGNVNYLKTEDYKHKNKITLNKKWNSDNIMKSDTFRYGKFSISKDKGYIKYLGDRHSLMECDNGHHFKIHIDNFIKRKISEIPVCTICNPIGDTKSFKEIEIFDYINSVYSGEIIQSYRDGYEIDIYLPELNLGFEFNGLYFHSEKFKDKNYHINKTDYFKDRGVRIIHIWEDDWIHRNNIIKSQINNWLGISNKLWARKCEVKIIKNNKHVSNFLNNNHIQGNGRSSVKIGLFYNKEIVSIMTFNHLEGRNKMSSNHWNINRFCNKKDVSVIGGASKILKYFIKEYSPNRIISYADNDWSNGNMYNKLGFSISKTPKPDYKYIVGGKRIHKSNFKKSKLKTNLTENKHMKNMNVLRIWDCGKIKFELILNKIIS
jgi:hypothetical protein